MPRPAQKYKNNPSIQAKTTQIKSNGQFLLFQ